MNQVGIKRQQMQICSQMLGMITLLILGNLLGANGIAYIAVAMETFLFFWTLTGSRIADVLGKMLRSRNTKGQYRNAAKMFRNAMLLEGSIGMVGSLIMFLTAPFFAERLMRVPYSTFLICILSPVVFLRTISGVISGYFQGEGTELPTVISLVLRQVGILVFSLLFSGLFGKYGDKVSALLRQENYAAMYRGIGIAAAVLVTEIFVLVFFAVVYRSGKKANRKNGTEGMRNTEAFGNQIRILYRGILPQILVAFLEFLPLWSGLVFFGKNLADVSGFSDYGVFYGKYIAVCGIVALPICAVLLGGAHRVSGCLRREEQRYARNYFSGGLHMGVICSAFFSVFMAILAPQVAGIFCETQSELAENMFRFGSFALLLVTIGFYFTQLLWLAGGRYFLMGALALYNIVYVISLTVMLNTKDAGILALIYAGLTAGVVYVVVSGVLFVYLAKIGVDWLQAIVIPVGTACLTGLIILFLSKTMTPHLGNLVTVIVCLIIGEVIYWGALLFTHNFREQELTYIPGGKWIRAVARILHVI